MGYLLLTCVIHSMLLLRLKNEHNVVVKYEDLKLTVKNKMDQLKKKASFIFMLKNKNSINEELDIYNKEKADKK